MNNWLIAALWLTLALAAALGSMRLGISVALVEILLGVFAGNLFHLQSTPWIDFLAGTGSILLTFLAGAEIDPDVMRANLRESVTIGFFSFLAPAVGAFAAAYLDLPLESPRGGDRRRCALDDFGRCCLRRHGRDRQE